MDPSPHTTAPRRGDQNGVLGAAGVSHAVAAPGGTKATVDVAAAASTAASAAPTDAEITNTVLGVAPTAAFSDAGADDDGEAAYWEEYEYEHEGGESGVFYYNHATGTNQYEEPECLVGVPHQLYHAEDGPAWHAYVDEAGYVYYYNHTTQASQYEQPDGDYVPLRAQFQALAKTPELKGTHAQHHRDGHRSDVDLGPGATAEHQVTGEAGTHSRHTAETSHAKTGSGSVVVRPASPTPAAHEPSSAAPSTAPQPVQGPRGNRSFQQAAPGALPPPHVSSKAGRGAGAGVGVGVDAGIGAHVESGAEDDPTFASDDSDSDSSSLSSASSRDVPWVPGLGVAPAPSRVFRVFKWQNVCHAAVCESPALAVESVLRCVGMLLAVVAVVLLLVMRRVPCAVAWHLLQMRLREAVIAFFSFPSFLLCVILPLSVYRTIPNDDSDWDVQPLWTLIGDVDPRRFWVIRHGTGSFAENIVGATRPSDWVMDTVWGRHVTVPRHSVLQTPHVTGPRTFRDSDAESEFGLSTSSDDEGSGSGDGDSAA